MKELVKNVAIVVAVNTAAYMGAALAADTVTKKIIKK